MTKSKWMVAAAATTMLAGVALAQAPARPAMPETRDAVSARVAEMFARLDADRNGVVTEAERGAVRQKRMEKRIEKRAEKRAERGAGQPMRDPRAAFDRLDSNRDGMLSPEEFARGREIRIEKRVERRGGRYGGGHGMAGMMFGMADSNRDGQVTLAEAQAMALSHFDMADTNRDGRIAAEERAAMHEKMRTMHQGMGHGGHHQDAKPAG